MGMRSVSELAGEWQNAMEEHQQRRAGLRDNQRSLLQDINKIRDNKPEGLKGKLTHAFTCVTKLPWLKYKLQNGIVDIRREDRARNLKAEKLFGELSGRIMAVPDTPAAVAAEYIGLQGLRDHMKSTRSAVSDAISACQSASTTEMIDTFSRSKLISLASTLRTREAVSEINRAGDELNELKKSLGQVKTLDKDMPSDLAWHNNFDFAIDMFSQFAGTFTSLTNLQKLGAAQEDLTKARGSIDTLDRQTQKQAYTLAASAAAHPEVGADIKALTASLLPHLEPSIRPDHNFGLKPAAPEAARSTAHKSRAISAGPA
ncbi:MAG: hypothetical protein Q8K65_00670 [Alphaproteobacteria bacterium]|nr:hypothetical protein [Alphaproteobacteria bacterium]